MRNLLLFVHLAAAIFWMGGMAFMLLALRPALGQLQPPQRLPLVAEVLRRFFAVVAASIAALLATGAVLIAGSGGSAPPGWHAMAGLGVLMMLVFGHIFFVPYRRLKAAVAQADWPAAGAAMGQMTLLVKVNMALGWIAIACVTLWR
jgi:uncharacterized membrane protein